MSLDRTECQPNQREKALALSQLRPGRVAEIMWHWAEGRCRIFGKRCSLPAPTFISLDKLRQPILYLQYFSTHWVDFLTKHFDTPGCLLFFFIIGILYDSRRNFCENCTDATGYLFCTFMYYGTWGWWRWHGRMCGVGDARIVVQKDAGAALRYAARKATT